MWRAADWLYPPHCASCDKAGFRLCPQCTQQIKRLNKVCCPTCGRPYTIGKENVCTDCIQAPPHYRALRSWGWYEGALRDALRALKYKRDIGLGELLAHHLIELFKQQDWQIDLIAPVPLGKARLEERGYNQSHYLALPIALSTGVPYKPQALQRTRNTASQVGLNTHERMENMRGAFEGNARYLKGKSILLVDDITTTGATLQACAEACCQAEAARVYGLTVARTPLTHPTAQKSDRNPSG